MNVNFYSFFFYPKFSLHSVVFMILKVEPYLFLFLIFLFLCLLFYCFVFSVYFPWVFSVSGCLDVDVEAPGSFRATGFVDLQGFFLRLSEGLSVMYLLEAELEGSGSDAG